MKFRSRPVVFAIATALGAGVAVPGALALTSTDSTQAPSVSKTTPTSVEEQHEAQAAEQHEAANSELGGANADQTTATQDTTTNDTAGTDGMVHADDQQNENTNVPGATGDEHRSDVAAQHSQADMHRATAPGVPANKAGDQSSATKPSTDQQGSDSSEVENETDDAETKDQQATTGEQHRGSHGDDTADSGSNN